MTLRPVSRACWQRAHDVIPSELLAESIAKALGAVPDDVRPLLVAASINAQPSTASDRLFAAETGGEAISHEKAMRVLDQTLDSLRGGFEATVRVAR